MTATMTSELDRVKRHQEVLEHAVAENGGSRAWRQWKLESANELIALANQAPRMEVLAMSLAGDLHINYAVKMPVPRWPIGERLVVGDRAVFHLHYVEDWLRQSPPPWAPLGLWEPHDPFHPNCAPALRGAICLGKLPPGIIAKELVFLGYFTLTLQFRMLDETDPFGVLNREACEYYRSHSEYLPLTHAGLFDAWSGLEGVDADGPDHVD